MIQGNWRLCKTLIMPVIKKICVVTVTYGERSSLLQTMVKSLTNSTYRVAQIIVVDNGSKDFELSVLQAEIPIDVVDLGWNKGSAAGFKAGLQRAMETECDFIWLLDDDNIPEPGALEALMGAQELLGNNETHIFAALRLNREKYVSAALTDSTLEVKTNAFLGFNLFDVPKKLWRKVVGVPLPKIDIAAVNTIKKISYGIYGGLLLHRNWIKRVGYPNESFYLYMDDTEYTSRLVQNGAQIYLVTNSRIIDIDVSWMQKSVKNIPPILEMETDTTKLYYTVRNSCFLSRDRFVNNRGIFYLNMITFFCIMFARGIFAGNSVNAMFRRFRFVIYATLEGLNGKLGYREIFSVEAK